MSDDRWTQIAANAPLRRTEGALLPESGWGALIAWIAGPSWVHPLHSADTRSPDGRSVSGVSNSQDQQGVDEDIAAFLAAAEVPAPDRGSLWVLRLPSDVTEEQLWDSIHRGLTEEVPQARHPRETRTGLERVLPRVLSADR